MLSRRDFANAVRALVMDAVQKANSGHPGMPMGMADIAEVLWNDFLNHNPNNPSWTNRDRFVLSNGHGCMLQYALLHLAGYDLSLDDIKRFRTLHSKTPGHPEYGDTPGIETTTGPLGQGFANAVGMALAEKNLAATFNRENFSVIDHYTYVFLGDGCLMEGVSHEAASLAGTWGLGKLVAFWDDNQVSIDGDTAGWFSDDTPARFRAYNWHVVENVDGHDPEAIKQAIIEAREETDKPTLICCRTVIGFGAPNKQGTAATHGAPLGEDEIAKARSCLEWYHKPFEIPQEYYQAWDARAKGAEREASWRALFSAYQETYPEQASELQRRLAKRLPQNFLQDMQHFVEKAQTITDTVATRKASAKCLENLGPALPELIGGSADLSESNNTLWSGSKILTKADPTGNYIHYGVREFGMFAIMNGLSLHGGFIPYGGTFLVFSDYGRNAIRLAALMRQKVIFVLTHDSIGLGEDGPTHQPIEHANMLRATPGLHVWRPADLTETAGAWQAAIERKGPSCLLLTRQGVLHLERSEECVMQIKRGGYTLLDCEGEPEAIVMATGSETHLALNAGKKLHAQGHRVRVVAMPCTEIFDAQSEGYRQSVLPDHVTVRVAVEAGAKDFWYKYVGLKGRVMGLDRFGFSAPYKDIYAHVGITEEKIIENVNDLLQKEIA